MGDWIRQRGVNGEWGYYNMKTRLFRTTLPNSNEEKTLEKVKHDNAVLKTYGRLKLIMHTRLGEGTVKYKPTLYVNNKGQADIAHEAVVEHEKQEPYKLNMLVNRIGANLGGSEDFYHSPVLGEILQGNTDDGISELTLDEKAKHYWDPIKGIPQRLETMSENNQNPLEAVWELPATLVALLGGLGKGAKTAVTAGKPLVSSLFRATASHPRMMFNIAKSHALPLAGDFVIGGIGGAVVDKTSESLTGKSWGENAHQVTGMPTWLGDFTNPGYLLGLKSFKFTPKITESGYSVLKEAELALADKATALADLANLESQLKSTLEAYNSAEATIQDRENLVRKLAELSEEISRKRKDLAKKIIFLTSDEDTAGRAYAVARNDVNVGYPDRKILNTFGLHRESVDYILGKKSPNVNTWGRAEAPYQVLSGSITKTPASVAFTDEAGVTTPANFEIVSRSNQSIPYRTPIYYTRSAAPGASGSYFAEMPTSGGPLYFTGDWSSYSNAINEYRNRVNQVMGDDGVVAGSVVSYGSGLFPATMINGTAHGVGDTEIYTTAARVEALKKKLGFKLTSTNSVGGINGTSAHTFRNTDPQHNGIDTEINIIEADDKGMAKGKLAHLVYRTLHPDEYAKTNTNAVLRDLDLTASMDRSLPVTAEELLLELRQHPEAMLEHLAFDMFGADKPKALNRTISVLFNPNPSATKLVSKTIDTTGRAFMEGYPEFRSLYPNLSFTDIAANEEFLQKAYKLSPEEAKLFASNPEIMENAVKAFEKNETTTFRRIDSLRVGEKANDGTPARDLRLEFFNGNATFGGGSASGDGLNTLLYHPHGNFYGSVVGVAKLPLTYHPETIKTPMDIYNKILEASKPTLDFHGVITPTFDSSTGKFTYDLTDWQRISDLSHKQDRPFITTNMSNGSPGGSYLGALSGEPVATGVVVDNGNVEAGTSWGNVFRELNNNHGVTKETPITSDEAIAAIDPNKRLESRAQRFADMWNAASTPRERAQLLDDYDFYKNDSGRSIRLPKKKRSHLGLRMDDSPTIEDYKKARREMYEKWLEMHLATKNRRMAEKENKQLLGKLNRVGNLLMNANNSKNRATLKAINLGQLLNHLKYNIGGKKLDIRNADKVYLHTKDLLLKFKQDHKKKLTKNGLEKFVYGLSFGLPLYGLASLMGLDRRDRIARMLDKNGYYDMTPEQLELYLNNHPRIKYYLEK